MTRTQYAASALLAATVLAAPATLAQQGSLGYYRFPALWKETIVFTAEGDLWRVPLAGGVAQRLTTHPAEESRPAISPDGRTLAFSAAYEGPTEVYTLPLSGGPPTRRTFEGGATVVGWTPSGEVLYATGRRSTLPNTQLVRLDPATGIERLVPLAQASDGVFDPDGETLFFTRLPFQGSHTRRYKGGTAQAIWAFTKGTEAVPLTGDYPGTSKAPMVWNDRVYFLTDRDGTMNLWSMDTRGGDLRQHTRHATYDVQSPSLSDGRIVYQLGADLRVYDIAREADTAVPITLVSDFDQLRERWVKDPFEWIASAHLSPSGDRVVLTARGQVFVIPAEQGRIVEATRNKLVRHRGARFFPDGKSILTLSDESGEVELWRVPADGLTAATQLTSDARVLRWDGVVSPDGHLLAHFDKDQQLWVYDLRTQANKRIAVSTSGGFDDVRWSPDSRWLAYTEPDPNQMTRLRVYEVSSGVSTPITSDRYDSYSPCWSTDGKWLYFLSDRHFVSTVASPWGSRQPEPFFDKQTKIYHVALVRGERSPYQPDDELFTRPRGGDEKKNSTDSKAEDSGATARGAGKADTGGKPATPTVRIDLQRIETRLLEVPVPPGNYSDLSTDGKRLYFLSRERAPDAKPSLKTFPIDNKRPEVTTFKDEILDYELSADGKKVLLRTDKELFVTDAAAKAPAQADLAKQALPLKEWTFSLNPRDEWRQMFTEAWRLERDYFYDRGMHGLDWQAIRQKYLPLVERVTDRAELSDVLAQMVSELSALHIFVRGGDIRRGQEDVQIASLGARLVPDDRRRGLRVAHIYRSDPDIPEELSPLARPGVDVEEGDVIVALNGRSLAWQAPSGDPAAAPAAAGPAPAGNSGPVQDARTTQPPTAGFSTPPDAGALLRGQANKQVRLDVIPRAGGRPRAVVVTPISPSRDDDLRYDEWEYTRRLEVERVSNGRIGYVHLRAMGGGNMAEWQREFYPVFDREGLIIDVRHNRGGNIDSWILEKLLRKAWFYWQPRVGQPIWNMQYAFRGHVVVLCNERTASDGEAFAEGFRRLGLGKLIGTRTWGGEIWLSSSNFLVDRGIATAAETGVYGPEGDWLIEGHGVDPDIVVDNLPHATFNDEDAQLQAAIAFLQKEIADKPLPVPPAPKYPIKSVPGVPLEKRP